MSLLLDGRSLQIRFARIRCIRGSRPGAESRAAFHLQTRKWVRLVDNKPACPTNEQSFVDVELLGVAWSHCSDGRRVVHRQSQLALLPQKRRTKSRLKVLERSDYHRTLSAPLNQRFT